MDPGPCLSSTPHNHWPFSFRGSFSVLGPPVSRFLFHQWPRLLGWLGLWCRWLLNCLSWTSYSSCLHSNRDWEGLMRAGPELEGVRYQLEFISSPWLLGEERWSLHSTAIPFSVSQCPASKTQQPCQCSLAPLPQPLHHCHPFQASSLPMPFLPVSVTWSRLGHL